MMTEPPLIALEGVRRHFDRGRIVALDGIDLSIGRDDCLAIVGKSGSGKSCLINIATGLDVPDAGRVLWEGRGISSRRAWAALRRTSIGIVFQEFHLLPTLSARQNVELALMGTEIGTREQRRRAGDALERVGLGARLDQLPAELSGGERQRVAIARALVREPRILFADEPTGNLDSVSAAAIVSLLFELHEERRSALVIVTHDEALANKCPHRVRVADGKVADEIVAQREPAK